MLNSSSGRSVVQRSALGPAAALLPWQCVGTERGKERLACLGIENLGVEALYLTYVVRLKNYKISIRGLFPGYIFVRLPYQEYWPRILNVTGVTQFLTNERSDSEYRYPANIAPERIAEITALADQQTQLGPRGVAYPRPVLPPFEQRIKPGMRVRILRGTFEKRIAICEATDQHRVEVLISMFQRDVKVEFHDSDLELVSDEDAQ